MNARIVSIIALSSIFLATVIGSSLVFVFKKNFSKTTGSIIIGLASGIMIATSFFGLIMPAIEEATIQNGKYIGAIPVTLGFLCGGAVLFLLDKIIPHFHKSSDEEEGIKTNKLSKRSKFILAVTLHNIPEGIAVGLVCGLCFAEPTQASFLSALSLAFGITIQNLPEGSAVSIPLLEDNVSKTKAFLLGSFTGIVEPLFAILSMLLAAFLSSTLPFLLAFAAGAMIYVTIDELIPDFKSSGHSHAGLWSFMAGFLVMMLLEILI